MMSVVGNGFLVHRLNHSATTTTLFYDCFVCLFFLKIKLLKRFHTTPLCFEFFPGVVLMSCRVNFHVVRSALQYSACRI